MACKCVTFAKPTACDLDIASARGSLKVLKGEATEIPPPHHPAIIELWATWQVFPHLSEIARKYRDKGLRVVGISLEEPSPSLEQFVIGQGPKMDYTVAVDPKGEVGQELMAAAGVSGIPHAFVVDAGGIVRFSGHPMDPGFDAAVQKVVAEGAPEPKAPQQELPAIEQSREELMALPIKDLKGMLKDRNIDMTGAAEKGDLVSLIQERCQGVSYYR